MRSKRQYISEEETKHENIHMEGAAKIINLAVWDGREHLPFVVKYQKLQLEYGNRRGNTVPSPLCGLYLAFPEG
jgi:hypothetical protein